jgi:hypothetical protein
VLAPGRPTSALDVMRNDVPLIVLLLIVVNAGTNSALGNDLEVPFTVLFTGGIPGARIASSTLMQARSDSELQVMWSQLNLRHTRAQSHEMPKVDFEHWTVVAFFAAGGDNCDPYNIHRVVEHERRVTVVLGHVQRIAESSACICGSFVFEPYIVLQIPSTKEPIDFEIEPESHGCTDDV